MRTVQAVESLRRNFDAQSSNLTFSHNIVKLAPAWWSCLADVGLICPGLRDDEIRCLCTARLTDLRHRPISACAIDQSVGQIRVSIGVKVRINGYRLVYRYTSNSTVRIKVSIRVRVSFITGVRIACHYLHRINSNPNPNSDRLISRSRVTFTIRSAWQVIKYVIQNLTLFSSNTSNFVQIYTFLPNSLQNYQFHIYVQNSTVLSLCISIATWMLHSFCIDRLLWGSTVGRPSHSWASCSEEVPKGMLYCPFTEC